jgi:hypothetical protein
MTRVRFPAGSTVHCCLLLLFSVVQWVFFFVPFWPGSYLLLPWMFSGLFPASAANEAADDTSGQWPHAAARLSTGTMPPDFTAPRFFPVLLHILFLHLHLLHLFGASYSVK